MQIVREVERDIMRREEQKREEQTLIDEVKLCIGLDPDHLQKLLLIFFDNILFRLRLPGLLIWRN